MSSKSTYKPKWEELPTSVKNRICGVCRFDSSYYQREYDGNEVSEEILLRYYQDLSSERVEIITDTVLVESERIYNDVRKLKQQFISDRALQSLVDEAQELGFYD